MIFIGYTGGHASDDGPRCVLRGRLSALPITPRYVPKQSARSFSWPRIAPIRNSF
jgi:hypothetical protein